MREARARAEGLQLLGLAKRAGSVASGIHRVREALRSGEAVLVLVAEDASEVQLRKIEGLLRVRAIPRVVLGDRAALGAASGGPPLSAVAVTDRRLAGLILRRLSGGMATES